ncbi:MAG TPA: hypothetical protein VHF89_20725 [Solirubrobacteraceae bacterium]|nr:hypothetical protein [Solirubrobacteraceae bacterium]
MARLTINFTPFGDLTQASARLRAWNLAEELRLQGHAAAVNGAGIGDVEVFQKVRPHDRLAAARRRPRTLTVYDIDDHYLLDDVGTKDDVVRFLNLVDLVTVGSEELLGAVSAWHPDVRLFENPLDVGAGAAPRAPSGWRGRIGWFGNRANLSALEALDLDYGVTTVTQGGDVEWDVATVDDVVRDFDLVLIPVGLDRWSAGKNANRLLKAIALGVPFLASRTPEHERAVRELGLPEWLLVGSGGAWNDAVAAVRDDVASVERMVLDAREQALRRFGIRTAATEWARTVREALERKRAAPAPGDAPAPAVARTVVAADALATTDVVVLNENDPRFAADALDSLERYADGVGSLTVVSANRLAEESPAPPTAVVLDEHADFFAIYERLAEALAGGTGTHVLLLRSGTRLTSGFFPEVAGTLAAAPIHLFREQFDDPAGELAPPPPLTLDQLLLRPFTPHALLVAREVLDAAGPIDPRLLSFATWDLLLGAFSLRDARVAYHSAPVVLVQPRPARRHLVQSYSVWVDLNQPELAPDLPSHDEEWARLSYLLHAAVVDRHRALFAERSPTLLPAIGDRLLRTERELTRLRAQEQRPGRERQRERDAAPPASAAASPGAEVVVSPPRPPRRYAPVRAAWRLTRGAVPARLRARLYPRLRKPYLRLFPERTPEPAERRRG